MTYDITKSLEEQGLVECPYCKGYGSSLMDPEGVDTCSLCGGDGVVALVVISPGEYLSEIDMINEIRYEEGNSILIPCDNPEPHGCGCYIEVIGDWTDWETLRIEGGNLRDVLGFAITAKRKKEKDDVDNNNGRGTD